MLRDADAPSFLAAVRKLGTPAAVWVTPLISDVGNYACPFKGRPWMDWYQSLAKPSWTPAPRTIGRIWQMFYPIIIMTVGYVFVQASRGRLPLVVALQWRD